MYNFILEIRNTYFTFVLMEAEKRESRSYKAKHTPYYDAVRRAWRENTTLAVLLEKVVEAYATGSNSVKISKSKNMS